MVKEDSPSRAEKTTGASHPDSPSPLLPAKNKRAVTLRPTVPYPVSATGVEQAAEVMAIKQNVPAIKQVVVECKNTGASSIPESEPFFSFVNLTGKYVLLFGLENKQCIRKILQQGHPAKIITLSPSETEIMQNKGLGVSIVQLTGQQFPPSITKCSVRQVIVGSFQDFEASVEERLNLIKPLCQ